MPAAGKNAMPAEYLKDTAAFLTVAEAWFGPAVRCGACGAPLSDAVLEAAAREQGRRYSARGAGKRGRPKAKPRAPRKAKPLADARPDMMVVDCNRCFAWHALGARGPDAICGCGCHVSSPVPVKTMRLDGRVKP